MPWMIIEQEGSYCIHRKLDDGSAGELLEGGCHPTMDEAESQLRALYASENVTEIESPSETESVAETDNSESTNGITEAELTELIAETGMHTRMSKEGRPVIPFAPGINPDDLKGDGGERPTFVELKIAEVGTVSEQKYLYDSELVDAIYEQIMTKRPGAVWGHPKPEDANTSFPDPVAFWVGAVRQGNTLWGKAWIRDAAAAKRVQDTKRVGGALTTSIWGRGKKMLKDAVIQIRDFNLERIDFAPMERAAAPMDGQFEIVYQMSANGGTSVTPEELKAELAKLTPDVVVGLLTADTYTRIGEMVAKKNEVLGAAGEQELISELTAQLNTANALISEMTKERDTLKETLKQRDASLFDHDVDATVRWATDWNTTTEPGKKNLKALRAYLKKALVAEMNPGEPMKDAMERVMNDDQYKPVIEMTKKEIGGGALTTQVVDQRAAQFIKPTDDQIADARSRLGI
jgi:hypothetical protein